MGKIELYYFAVDALVKVVKEDPSCIPLRRFFDQEVRVLSTKQCYDTALEIFLEDRIDKSKATVFFSTYLEKVQVVNPSAEESKELMRKHSIDEPGASLIAALRFGAPAAEASGSEYFLVTSDPPLISAAHKEGFSFHDYTQEQFCEKYGY